MIALGLTFVATLSITLFSIWTSENMDHPRIFKVIILFAQFDLTKIWYIDLIVLAVVIVACLVAFAWRNHIMKIVISTVACLAFMFVSVDKLLLLLTYSSPLPKKVPRLPHAAHYGWP